MGLFELINLFWQRFLNLFPPEWQLLISSIVLIALIVSFISLFMFNPFIFIIVLIIALPILYPIVVTFLTEFGKLTGIIPKSPIRPILPK